MGVLGFNTTPKTGGGDFLPYVKYHAPAGRMFRVDRVQITGTNNFESLETDITSIFKAQFDFENLEVGWLKFAATQAPSLVLVKYGSLFPPEPLPAKSHKEGARWMLKLSKECADGTPPVREIAGNASSMMAGVDAVMAQYLAEKDKHAGLLPVVTLVKTMPIKTGTAERASTNYQPVFEIIDWKPRGDLVFVSKAGAVASTASSAAPAGSGGVPNAATAPTTGSTRAAAPTQQARQTVDVADDFG